MKLIIAGSRTFSNSYEIVPHAMELHNLFMPDVIISGGAKGVDTAAERYADFEGIAFQLFKADWEAHGKAAGPIRNRAMAEAGDALLLIWDGKSPGSANMMKTMLELNKPVYEVVLRKRGDPAWEKDEPVL